MLDPLSNQTDKPQPLLSQEQTQPANVPPASQSYIIQQPSQPYVVQLANQPYAVQQPSQPYIIQLPPQSNVIQQPNQPYVIKAPTQTVQTTNQPYIIQTSNQPLVIQPGLQINTDSKNLKEKLCCIRIWTIIMFVPSIIDVFININNYALPVSGIAGIIALGIVSYFIYRSVKTCDVGKYEIALHTYVVFFVVACVFYIFVVLYSGLSSSRRNRLAVLYFFETGPEIITLYFLFAFKKEFDGVSKKENVMSIAPLPV